MILLYTDETNLDPGEGKFFVYAGASVPDSSARALHDAIEHLRKENGYKPGDLLKFNTHQRPDHVDAGMHREAKRQLLEQSATHGVKLFASMILHKIATSPEDARKNEINRVCSAFHDYLDREDTSGLVLVDNFEQHASHLREKFSIGLRFPDANQRLTRVLGFHAATVGTSHFCSVVDVALGSLRHVINTSEKPSKATSEIAALLAPLMIRNPNGRVSSLSLFFSPMRVRVPEYRAEYLRLSKFFEENGMQPAASVDVG